MGAGARGQGRDRHRRRQRHRPRDRRAVRRGRRAASSSPTSTPSAARSSRPSSATRPRSSATDVARRRPGAGARRLRGRAVRRARTSCATTPASASSFDRFLDDDFADFDRVMAREPLRRHGRHAARGAAHGGARRRFDRQHHVDRRDQRRRRADRLPRVEGRGRPLHPVAPPIDLADHGIRVNCIAPATSRPRSRNYDLGPVIQFDAAAAAARSTRATSPNAALYLASDRAAQVTGIVLPGRRRDDAPGRR